MAKRKKKDIEVTESSGCVYKDLGIDKPKIIIGMKIVKGYIKHTVEGENIHVERRTVDGNDLMEPFGIQHVECDEYTGRAVLCESLIEDHDEEGYVQYMRFKKGDKV